MNATVGSEFASLAAAAQESAELSVVWKSNFGDILIEVRNGKVYVAGDVVEPALSDDQTLSRNDGSVKQGE